MKKIKEMHRLFIGCLLCLLFVGNTFAQDGQFVIKKRTDAGDTDTHYLAHVYNETTHEWELQDATEFSPDCLWHSDREFNIAGTNHNYYFYDGANYRFLKAPLSSNGTLSLSDSTPETYLLNNSDEDYYFYGWDPEVSGSSDGKGLARGHQYTDVTSQEACTACGGNWYHTSNNPDKYECWEVYWVEHNGSWKMTEQSSYNITEHSARFRAVEATPHSQVITPVSGGLTALTVPSEMEWSDSPLTSQTLSATANTFTYTFVPAYTTYVFDGTTHNYCNSSFPANHGDLFSNEPSSENGGGSTNTVSGYHWSITGDGIDYLSFDSGSEVYTSDEEEPTLYYRIQNTEGHKTARITLTVTFNDGIQRSLSQDVTVKTTCQNPAQASAPVVTYTDVTVSWYPTASKYKLEWTKASDAGWTSAQTVSDYTGTTYSITGLEYGTDYQYRVTAFCGEAYLSSPSGSTGTFSTHTRPNVFGNGSVFGGGRMADVGGNTEVIIINCDGISAVYGGNDIAGVVGKVSGAEGSTIILGVNTGDTYANTYNEGHASTKVKVGDVYGGGNGYYAYNGTSFEAASNDYASQSVAANGGHVNAMTQSHTVGEAVWTNNTENDKILPFPTIKSTSITVTNNVVTVDSIFGGAKNAFITNDVSTANGTSIAIHGGTVFAVFGGNNFGGTQTAGKHHVEVIGTTTDFNLSHSSGLGRDFGVGYVFGGGNKVQGLTTDVLITGGQCDTVFAGGNAASVAEASVKVNCAFGSGDGSVFQDLYTNAIQSYDGTTLSMKDDYAWNGTGVYNVRTLFGGNNKAAMSIVPTVTLTSGSVGTVYGGGNAGDMTAADETLGNQVAADFDRPEVAIGGATTPQPQNIKCSTHVEVNSTSMFIDNLYGGCQMSNVEYSTWVEVHQGHVGNVFGGCNISGDVGSTPMIGWFNGIPGDQYQYVNGATYVKAAGGTIYKNLFAGSNGYYHCNDGVQYIDGIITEGHYVGMNIPTHNETHVKVCGNVHVKGNVYAGGNLAPVGFIEETDQGHRYRDFVGFASVNMLNGTVDGDVFGGGNMASIYGSNAVSVSGGTIGGALYGGNDRCGLVAQITNRVLPESYNKASDQRISLTSMGVHTYVGITGKPQINTVYGGGNGAYDYTAANFCNPNDQPVQSNTFVDIHIDATGGEGVGGRINTVYGGGNGVTVTGGTTVLVNVEHVDDSYQQVGKIFGGNNMGDLSILPDVILLSGRVDTLYGGCNSGAMTGSFTVEGYDNVGSRIILRDTYTPVGSTEPITLSGVVTGAVYGGCRMNDVTNNTLVLVENGTHTAQLFGGSDVSGTVYGDAQVIVTGGSITNAYGGGNGNYIYENNNVYSTTNNALIAEGTSTNPITPPHCKTSKVEMTGGTADYLYAGSYAGTCGDTYMDVLNGTVNHDVFGGGYGASSSTSGDVSVTIGLADNTHKPTITGNVYGGSALGNVNADANNQTTVNILNGTISGDIYGGGLGDKASLGDGHSDVAPAVNGKVEVNIGSITPSTTPPSYWGQAIFGENSKVFGCNNLNGSPQADVTVNIYSTGHDDDDVYPANADQLSASDLLGITNKKYFSLQAVYGGGNEADYAPANSTNITTVHIHQCDQNTIKDVFGGSNKASAQNTNVIIDGGHIDRTFGGGNGESGPAPVVGTAKTVINAGLITQVFGGSNTNGNVGNIELEFKESNCLELIYEIFNGSNEASLFGEIVTNLVGNCYDPAHPRDPDGYNFYGGANLATIYGNVTLNVFGGYYINVFGGSKGNLSANKSADIKKYPYISEIESNPNNYPSGLKEYLEANESLQGTGGNVTLNLYGGKIENAFGGSDQLGNIEGKIMVRVFDGGGTLPAEQTSRCELDLTNVYGGGNETAYTAPGDPTDPDDENWNYPRVSIINGTVLNNVFGGGKGTGATTIGNPVVTIGDVTTGHESYEAVVGRRESVNIGGNNVYVDYGNVYGGGELAQVHGSTKVLVQKANTIVKGTVYGGGKGMELNDLTTPAAMLDHTLPAYHPEADRDAGLVKGNATVEMTGGDIQRSIYGGGELGSVGTFTAYYEASDAEVLNKLHVVGEPKTCALGTGLTTVKISGGRVGMINDNNGLMPNPLNPTSYDDYGYVFCASKGEVDSINYPTVNLLAIVDTTYLEISGSAVVTASAYGGSENGQVLHNTYVKIAGGQIGLGHYVIKSTGEHRWDNPYSEAKWNKAINAVKDGSFNDYYADTAAFHMCDAWPFGPEDQRYVYDHYATYPLNGVYYYDEAHKYSSEGGSYKGADGHSFFGHVFGGGSGYYPIAPDPTNSRPIPIWRRSAGRVCGDTYVEITGGHILSNVYGGNEITDVLGYSKVEMSGGTIGVPRSLDSIQGRPVNSNLYGGGMGDPRIMFNKWSNVGSSEVIVKGNAVVFGSVFGGGEDCHILGNAKTTIGGDPAPNGDDGIIGTFGTSSVDGNVFGGGRGFSATALTAGVVCGNVELNIKDNAKILGSVYGGGRMAAVGTYLAAVDTPNYGVLQGGSDHGNITINISGGTIGNASQMNNGNGNSIGDVFGGSRGTLLKDAIRNQRLGLVLNTTVNISGTARIYGSVYGGGGLASVGKYTYATADDVTAYNLTHPTEPLTVGDVLNCVEGGEAIVRITGGTIGKTDISYPYGHVFGGCLGRAGTAYSGYSFVNQSTVILNNGTVYGSVFGGGENGHVLDQTQVNVSGGSIGIPLHNLASPTDNTIYRGNVYGGGRGIDKTQTGTYSITAGKVSGNTNVSITGGQIYRNVYGGGSLASVGDPDEVAQPDGSFLTGLATVTVTGGMIGTDGGYYNSGYYNNQPFNHLLENGHVFGSGRGVAGEAGSDYIHLAYVKDSDVTIGGTAYVTGSVFGSGENGHVRKDTKVTIEAGTGTFETETHVSTGEPYPIIGYPLATDEMQEDVNTPILVYRGNVYGGGRGIDHTTQTNALSYTAGVVERNTNVIIEGGTIRHNVYGGGSLARVGDPNETPQADGHFLTGHANVTISGGQIGMSEEAVNKLYNVAGNLYSGHNNGQVYGSGRGVAGAIYAQLAYVKYSHVNISGGAAFGSVFGGGENGHVRKDTEVNISGGTIGIEDYNVASEVYRGNVYGGGRGIDHDETNHNINKTEGTVLGNSNIHITGGTIYHNVYGGGSLASVGTITYDSNNQVTSIAEGTGKATIVIDQADGKTTLIGLNGANNGRVFGSGRGYPGIEQVTVGGNTFTIDYSNLTYVNNTDITFNNGTIKGSIFGSGDNGHVFGDTRVVMNGGFLGNAAETNTSNHIEDGNIFGGGRGSDRYGNGKVSPTAGHVGGNTYVEVNGGTMLHNIYGGGHMASVGNYTTNAQGEITGHTSGGDVTIVIKGGTVGIDGNNNGRVFGAGRGAAGSDSYGNDYTHLTYVNNTYVNIMDGANIKGSVFGSGDNGHTWTDTHVTMTGGTIGTTGDLIDGNIFGGGHGQDPIAGTTNLSITAGKVFGDTHVNMTGGTVKANIYGGGNMSTVAGTANVEVSGSATVGVSTYTNGGKVFGASRGDAGKPTFATVNHTIVNITGANVDILSNVYGGGENGAVNGSTDVTIDGATLNNVYGAGQGTSNDNPVNNADVCLSTKVTMNSGIVNGSVYGGGEYGSVGIPYDNTAAPAGGAISTVSIEGGHVMGSAFGGGNLGFNKGATFMNLSNGAIVDENIFGGAYGSLNKVYVAGLHTVNMRGGTVYGNVYGGSRNADDALNFNGNYSLTESGHVSVVNISGGHAVNHVFASGYFGKAYGSVYAFIGTKAIMNAPNNTFNASDPTYNQAYYNNHTALIIDRDVWAGADYGDYTAGQFGDPTISGQSNIYVDGLGYDTENDAPTNDPSHSITVNDFMILRNSIYGCGTSCDAASVGKRHIIVRNYGKVVAASGFDPNSKSLKEPYTSTTRDLFSIQRADDLVIDNSNINLIGQGKVNSFNATEKYSIHEFNTVRVTNNSSIFINKPVEQIKKIGSYTCSDVYASTPQYTVVNYTALDPTDNTTYQKNKVRVNQGTHLSVVYRTTSGSTTEVLYGELEGYFFMMTDGAERTFAFARPKQSSDSGNSIGTGFDNPLDGGFVSYHINLNTFSAGTLTGGAFAQVNDAPGTVTNGVQIPYDNHAPVRSGELYFRVWRYSDPNVQHTLREGVLNAIVHTGAGTSPNDFYRSEAVRITLPPSVGDGSYYRIQLIGGEGCNITYGTEYVMVNGGLYDENQHWMYTERVSGPTNDVFVYNPDPIPASITNAQDNMQATPNNAFGLVAVPVSGLESDSNKPWLICNESAEEVLRNPNTKWVNNNNNIMPEIDFYLTYSNAINGNNVWDPVVIFLEQYNQAGQLIDEVEIRLVITTITDISQTITTQTFALMFGDATAPTQETYTTKILLPAYNVQGPNYSAWTLEKIEWIPTTDFDQNTLVDHAGTPTPDYVGTTEKVGMTINPSLNFDNSNGWHNNPLNVSPIDVAINKMNGSTNPIQTPIWLGETDGRNPISFNAILYYDATVQTLTEKKQMGTVELTMKFTNQMGTNTAQTLKIKIEVWRKGDGTVYYIDGVHGAIAYDGTKPDAAKPNLANILYFTNFTPGDVIYIVDKITVTAIEEREWNGQPYNKLKFYRYDGGHAVWGYDSSEPHYKDYDYTNNPAYLGPLIDIHGKMTISSSLIDGSYHGNPYHADAATEAHAPLINVSDGGELTLLGGTVYHSDLVHNYNQAPSTGAINAGGINIEEGGTVRINNYVYIEDNYVDGVYGGGVYLEEGGTLLLSDLVTINNNKKVEGSNQIAQNVYLEDFNTNIQIGTLDPTDIYESIDASSKIGITKTDWKSYDYMPVLYAEDGDHLTNLHCKDIVFDDQGIYRPQIFEMANPAVADPENHLFFVKTWTTEVRSNPDAPNVFDASNIDSPEKLAWAISVINGLNGCTAAPTTNFTLTGDIDMSANIWDVIGNTDLADTVVYSGVFEGNGHTVKGIHSQLTRGNMGMFGKTVDATIRNLIVETDFENGTADTLGALVGTMDGGVISNIETAGILKGKDGTVSIGGVIGKIKSGTLHSSFAVNTIIGNVTSVVGGLVGINKGNLFNAYGDIALGIGNEATSIGGLAGINEGVIENCYVEFQGTEPSSGFGWFANTNSGTITYCYSPAGKTQYYVNGTAPTGHGNYGAVRDRKAIGYMYDDNKVSLISGQANPHYSSKISYLDENGNHMSYITQWPGMMSALNHWVKEKNAITESSSPYYGMNFDRWFRPTSVNINGDLPVLAFPKDNCMATLDADGQFLQYSATAYLDDNNATQPHTNDAKNGIDVLLADYAGKTASIFLYNDATNVTNVPTDYLKVFVNEDVCLLQSSSSGNFINTTVGITFDNSSRQAEDYFQNTLTYDWHLMSTSLSDAKIGATYSHISGNTYTPDTEHTFQTSPADLESLTDSYFPNGLNLTAEPYWDFYAYFEPEYHWINLKRNKKNHFHREAHQGVYPDIFQLDEFESNFPHRQINYTGSDQTDVKASTGDDRCVFTPGKGYMMAISQESYMNNTGTLNNGTITIPVTALAPDQIMAVSTDKGSNLLGNPYQAYLDLDAVAGANTFLNGFWIYDADQGVYAPYDKGASTNPAIPSQYIHPHQGFFVVYKPATGDPTSKNLTFNYSMAGTAKDNESYFRSMRPCYPLVNLYVFDTLGNRDLAIVEFNRSEVGGVKKIDNLRNAEFKLYAHFNDEDYGLLFTPRKTARVPVFFKTPNDGTYTLTWETHNGTFSTMRLIDNLTGTNYDMLTNDHYTFTASATDYAARFYIVFTVTDVNEFEEEHEIFAYFNGEGWVVEGEGQLELVDMLGQVLYADHLSGEPTIVHFGNFAGGVYMLRLVNSNKILKVQKIVIE